MESAAPGKTTHTWCLEESLPGGIPHVTLVMIPSLRTHAGWWRQPKRRSWIWQCGVRILNWCDIYSPLKMNFFCLYFKAQTVKILSVIYRLVQSDSFATKRFILASVNTDMWCSLCIRYLLRMRMLFPQRHLLRQHSAVWLPEICGHHRGRHLLPAEGASQSLTRGRCAFVVPD